MRQIKMMCALVSLFLLSACATTIKMGVVKTTDKIDLQDEALVLMSAELINEYRPSYQPKAISLMILRQDSQGENESMICRADDEGTVITDTGNRYVFRLMLKKGKYTIRGIAGTSGVFPVMGNFFMPLHSDIEITDSSVVYVGKIKGKVRERKDNEFRAGSLIPLIDQCITGFSRGTFDVDIMDNHEEDIKNMKILFPALADVEIKTMMLPSFDRDKAQKWWEDH